MKASADDLVLTLQRAIDRFIRRLRRGDPPIPTLPRFLIVQIDGLSRLVLEQGLASGRMSFVKMLERDGCRQEAMSVSLPTSTPAFRWRRSMVCTLTSRASTITAESAKETFTSLDPDTPLGSRPDMPAAGEAFSKAAAHTVAASPEAPKTISSLSPA